MPSSFNSVRILGIDFFNDSLERALEIAHGEGGLFLAPSGPGLSEIGRNSHYDQALQEADINLIDSGYLALLWARLTDQKLQRHSGLKFIKALVESPEFKSNRNQLWVMPDSAGMKDTNTYLQSEDIELGTDSFYEAPYYKSKKIEDEILLEKIRKQRPHYVILCIAGGKQEVLGHWLRQELDYKPAIICIGAAIAFLNGQQAIIPAWADRIYIGWLLRILQNPKTFLPRYWKARTLRNLVQKHRDAFPQNA